MPHLLLSEDIVPPPGKREPITIKEAADKFLAAGYDNTRTLLMPNAKELLRILGKSLRFSECGLCYVDKVSEEFVTFRGTDNTLVGWKEDFRDGKKEPARHPPKADRA